MMDAVIAVRFAGRAEHNCGGGSDGEKNDKMKDAHGSIAI